MQIKAMSNENIYRKLYTCFFIADGEFVVGDDRDKFSDQMHMGGTSYMFTLPKDRDLYNTILLVKYSIVGLPVNYSAMVYDNLFQRYCCLTTGILWETTKRDWNYAGNYFNMPENHDIYTISPLDETQNSLLTKSIDEHGWFEPFTDNNPNIDPVIKNAAVGIIMNNKDEILLLERRKDDRNTGYGWCLPGGVKENDDKSVLHCLTREIKEETGIDITIGDFYYLTEKINYKEVRKRNFNINFFVVNQRNDYNNITISNEHTSYKWFSMDEIKESNDILRLTKDVLVSDNFKEFVERNVDLI